MTTNLNERGKHCPKVEDVRKPIVGKFYWVRARQMIKNTFSLAKDDWIPLLGGEHEDTDIGSPEDHWHVDWRFMPTSVVRYRTKGHSGKTPETTRPRQSKPASLTGMILTRRQLGDEERLILRKMMRQHPTFPSWHGSRALEAKYAGAVAKCLICPHRGMPLAGAPVRNGALVCPGHGLAYDKDTLVLKPRQNSVGDPAKA